MYSGTIYTLSKVYRSEFLFHCYHYRSFFFCVSVPRQKKTSVRFLVGFRGGEVSSCTTKTHLIVRVRIWSVMGSLGSSMASAFCGQSCPNFHWLMWAFWQTKRETGMKWPWICCVKVNVVDLVHASGFVCCSWNQMFYSEWKTSGLFRESRGDKNIPSFSVCRWERDGAHCTCTRPLTVVWCMHAHARPQLQRYATLLLLEWRSRVYCPL